MTKETFLYEGGNSLMEEQFLNVKLTSTFQIKSSVNFLIYQSEAFARYKQCVITDRKRIIKAQCIHGIKYLRMDQVEFVSVYILYIYIFIIYIYIHIYLSIYLSICLYTTFFSCIIFIKKSTQYKEC